MIWRICTSSDFNESYDAVAAWELPRIVAANDLIDALALARENARADARAAAEKG